MCPLHVNRAQRVGVELDWGYPWPGSEIAPPQMAVTPPSHLQDLLGDSYSCGNFAVSGVTLAEKGHNPYVARPQFRGALAFQPEIVVINLGYNDANAFNW